jgi:hypothetical protein
MLQFVHPARSLGGCLATIGWHGWMKAAGAFNGLPRELRQELRDGLPERVLALHARPQEILANANFFHGGDLGWTDGGADQGFRESQRMELTERGI